MADTTSALPPASEPVVDRYRRWTPNWFRFIKPLLETTRSTALRVEAVSTEAAALVATEATTRATADTTIASNLTTVSTTVNGLTTAVTQNTASINGIEAYTTTAVTVGGVVVGSVRLDGTPMGSSFRVSVDDFIVCKTDGTEATEVFAIGTVDGVTTIGIKGETIIDGSVTARHLSVTSLDAITANFGDAVFEGVAKGTDEKLIIDFDTPRIRMVAA